MPDDSAPAPRERRHPGRREIIVGGATLAAGGLAVGATGACTSPVRTPGAAPAASGTSASGTSGHTSGGPSPTRAEPSVLTTPGPDILNGPRTATAVALTFHGAGDTALVTRLLDLLASRSVQATVFAVGTWATAHPDLLRRLVADGHDVGNHTWSHQAMTHLSPTQAYDEISRGADAVAATLGSPGPLFRPSGTQLSNATIRAAAQRAGYERCLSYDVDSLDYTDPSVDAVVAAATRGLTGGSIISLHFGHAVTIDAIPRILDVLAQRNLSTTTVTTLLA